MQSEVHMHPIFSQYILQTSISQIHWKRIINKPYVLAVRHPHMLHFTEFDW